MASAIFISSDKGLTLAVVFTEAPMPKRSLGVLPHFVDKQVNHLVYS